MNTYVARQPIFGKDKELFAYELLFRGGTENVFPDIDGNAATSQVLTTSFLNFDIDTISNNKLCFINFTEELLLNMVPTLFPRDRIVVEILEDVKPTTEVVQAIKNMSEKGYKIALDDFEYEPSLDCLVDVCHIIKMDFRLTPLDEIKELIGMLRGKNISFLAEKVEAYEEFQAALDMGFIYFQGYFFSKPEVIGGKALNSSSISMLQLIDEVNSDDYDIAKVEHHINVDIGISYKLLRYINSATFSREQKITSIKHAIAYLGINETRRFISLVALAEVSSGKPHELIFSSITRARFCELLGGISKFDVDHDELFMLGLFSLIDAILDADMETLLKKLPLSKAIKYALTSEDGQLYQYLSLASYYEIGDWKRCNKLIHDLEIDENELPACYANAIEWSNEYATV